MNDNAIEKRTKLRLEDEAERQMQLLEDLKLEKRLERSEKGRKNIDTRSLALQLISFD